MVAPVTSVGKVRPTSVRTAIFRRAFTAETHLTCFSAEDKTCNADDYTEQQENCEHNDRPLPLDQAIIFAKYAGIGHLRWFGRACIRHHLDVASNVASETNPMISKRIVEIIHLWLACTRIG